MNVSGQSAIVTGGASGLGRATAIALHEAGALVTIIDLDIDAGDELSAALGARAQFIPADVTDVAAVKNAVTSAASMAPLRVAVNCAGIAIGSRVIDRHGEPADLGAFRAVIDVNLIGTYNVASRAAAAIANEEPLQDGERGVVINTASIAAFEGQIGQTAYAASKAAVAGLTLPMARDLSSVGIRVNTIAPGVIDTKLLAGLNDEMREALAAGVPFPKRLGTPEDFASLVMSIVDNGYLNGTTLRLDGALRMPPR